MDIRKYILYKSLHDLHLFLLLGSKHELGTDGLVEVLLAQSLELHSTLLEGETLLVSVLGDLGGHVVANDGVKAGDKHERLVEESIDSLLVGLKTLNQVLLERAHTVAQQTGAVEEVADHDGLEDVQLEVTLRTSEGDSGLVTEDLAAEHGQRLALSGVDLAGHDG